MNQLRRRFANLWKRGDSVGRDQERENVDNVRRSCTGASSAPQVPVALELDATGSASPRRDGQRESKEQEGDENASPPRLLSLSHPWGTSDARPPPGWTSSSSLQVSQQRSYRRSVHVRRHSASDKYENGVADDGRRSSKVGVGLSAATTAASVVASGGGGGRRRGREDDEDGCAYHSSLYRNNSCPSNTSASKRHRAEQNEKEKQLAANGGHGGEEVREEGLKQQRRGQTSRRRRTCPADSTFVSPTAKLSVTYCTSTAGATAGAVVVDEDQEELERRRSSTPSRLTLRAGFVRALRGSRAVAKRARSATKLKRKTRELQAAIARQAFHSAHPPQRGYDDSDDGEQKEEKEDEEEVPRRVQGGTLIVSALGKGDDEMWRRVNLAEEEQGKAAEEKAMARLRRLENLRAEALAAFEEAQKALAELVATANSAFNAAEGPDMATLRRLFAEGGGNPSSRFKDSKQVIALKEKYSALEDWLQEINQAKDAGDSGRLEALLESEAAKGLESQPEVVLASEALRETKRLAEEAQVKINKEAEDARAAAAASAAAAAVEAAKTQREQDEVAAAAASERAQVEGREAARAAAAAGAAAEEDRFVERANELRADVQRRRAAVADILASADPGVKKIRMAFKKSYQGCLNKLSATPSTVRLVARDIQLKAEAPLAEARRGGWEAQAKDFLFFNLADKLVDFAERDHFSGDSYRMAFPLACLAMDLMAEHAGLSDLFLGILYSRCPSAVPALSFDTAGLSDGEVMAMFGQMEGEDLSAFLNRTKGLVVLMAAVMQTPPQGGASTGHPLPLSLGWRWLARFVNGLAMYVKKGNPLPVPTGPVLEWFLKVAGFELQRRYGRAFDKVVQTIKTEILPILLPKAIVPHLLDVVMEDYEGRGPRFLPPAGRDKEFRNFRAWGDT